ncbi:MAG: hypothetical protein WCD52_03030, partial [Xanthobacteraceae bacterium]
SGSVHADSGFSCKTHPIESARKNAYERKLTNSRLLRQDEGRMAILGVSHPIEARGQSAA